MLRSVIGRCVVSVSEGRPMYWTQLVLHPTYVKRTFDPKHLHPQLQHKSSWFRWLLYMDALLAAKAYGYFARRRKTYYLSKSVKLDVPVISVGNLTWGGNGKTPMVEKISALLQDEYKKIPLIISSVFYTNSSDDFY